MSRKPPIVYRRGMAKRAVPRPRGEVVETAILEAAVDELARVGPWGVSVDRIAAQAGVNKTTVYRRWPTIEALMAAAAAHLMHRTALNFVDRGSLRADLEFVVDATVTLVSSRVGRATLQLGLAEAMAKELGRVASSTLRREPDAVRAIVDRAVKRGEWALEQSPPEVVFTMLAGAVVHRVLIENLEATPAWRAALIGMLLRGVAPAKTR